MRRKQPPVINIRSIWVWLLPVPIAFVASLFWLRWTAFYLSIVIYYAPYGLISFFREGFDPNRSINETTDAPLLIGIHAAFWISLIAFLALRSILPKWGLWLGWGVLMTTLSVTMIGCARHFQAPHIP